MNYVYVFAALMQSVKDVATLLEVDDAAIRWPGTFKVLPATGVALTVDLLPASHDSVTLGDRGEDEHLGLLQLGLIYPLPSGLGAVNQAYQTLLDFYVAGKSFSHETAKVQVLQCRRSPTLSEAASQKTFVTVSWRSRFTRPSIL